MTNGYWRDVLGGDPGVIGRRIRVDGTKKTIIGVLPRGYSFLSSKARLYFPLSSNPEQRGPDRRHWGSQAEMVARLAPGKTITDAQAEIDAHNAAVEKDGRDAKEMAAAGFRSIVVPLHADHVAAIRPTLLLVQAGALLLLAIGAVNLANLLLIRAAARAREFAVRQAIGASRWHVIGEVMVETLVLTVLGGVAGMGLGAGGVQLLQSLGADRLPLGARIAFDGAPGTRVSGRGSGNRRRSRRADRLVQPAGAVGRRAALALARRHREPRGDPRPPRVSDRADGPGVRSARGRRATGPQPPEGDVARAWLPAGPRDDGTALAAVAHLRERRRTIGLHRAPPGSACPPTRRSRPPPS